MQLLPLDRVIIWRAHDLAQWRQPHCWRPWYRFSSGAPKYLAGDLSLEALLKAATALPD